MLMPGADICFSAGSPIIEIQWFKGALDSRIML